MKKQKKSRNEDLIKDLNGYIADKKSCEENLKTRLSKSERARIEALKFLNELGIALCTISIKIQKEIQRREAKK